MHEDHEHKQDEAHLEEGYNRYRCPYVELEVRAQSYHPCVTILVGVGRGYVLKNLHLTKE